MMRRSLIAAALVASFAALASPGFAKFHHPGDGNADTPLQRAAASPASAPGALPPCDDGSGGLQDREAMKGRHGKDGSRTGLAPCGSTSTAPAAPAAEDPQALKGHHNGVGQ